MEVADERGGGRMIRALGAALAIGVCGLIVWAAFANPLPRPATHADYQLLSRDLKSPSAVCLAARTDEVRCATAVARPIPQSAEGVRALGLRAREFAACMRKNGVDIGRPRAFVTKQGFGVRFPRYDTDSAGFTRAYARCHGLVRVRASRGGN